MVQAAPRRIGHSNSKLSSVAETQSLTTTAPRHKKSASSVTFRQMRSFLQHTAAGLLSRRVGSTKLNSAVRSNPLGELVGSFSRDRIPKAAPKTNFCGTPNSVQSYTASPATMSGMFFGKAVVSRHGGDAAQNDVPLRQPP